MEKCRRMKRPQFASKSWIFSVYRPVGVLKRSDWYESPVINHGHDRPGQPGKKRDNELDRGLSKRRSSDARQLGCVFQDMTPPKSILRKGTDIPKPIQRVKFTKATTRHTKIRDQNPSLGMICPGDPHQRNPNTPNIWGSVSGRDGEWQERCAREAAWRLANGLTSSQNATMLDDREEFTLLILMTKSFSKLLTTKERNWKDFWQQPRRAKEKLGLATRKWLRRKLHPKKVPNTVCGSFVESHQSTRQRVESSLPAKH